MCENVEESENFHISGTRIQNDDHCAEHVFEMGLGKKYFTAANIRIIYAAHHITTKTKQQYCLSIFLPLRLSLPKKLRTSSTFLSLSPFETFMRITLT